MQVGVLAPEAVATGKLCTGQVGYLITGMKTTKSARVGDTWHLAKQSVEALPGFKPAKSMVFSGQHAHFACFTTWPALLLVTLLLPMLLLLLHVEHVQLTMPVMSSKLSRPILCCLLVCWSFKKFGQ